MRKNKREFQWGSLYFAVFLQIKPVKMCLFCIFCLNVV